MAMSYVVCVGFDQLRVAWANERVEGVVGVRHVLNPCFGDRF